MAIKIDKKIVKYNVKDLATAKQEMADKEREQEREKAALKLSIESNIQYMHESVERPEILMGTTYKIKTPLSEHALYITINDIVLNPDTEHEHRRPFEVFINSKNMDHFQWVVALTRVISAVFRKGGDVTFLVEELKAVFDPQGGYFKRGGKYVPSLVAELGMVIESHMKMLGLITDTEMDAHRKAMIEDKKKAIAAAESASTSAKSTDDDGDFPASAELCNKCHTKASVMMDGCMTCLSCGYSKCG